MKSMATQDAPRDSIQEIARRLQWTRIALELSQADICRITNIEPAAWNNNERGRNLISLSQALKLSAGVGVSLDWIYKGRMDHLPIDLAIRIQALMKDPDPGPGGPQQAA